MTTGYNPEDDWTLEAGAVATVVAVAENGDLKLRNAAGRTRLDSAGNKAIRCMPAGHEQRAFM